jgi:hypothetical protein
MRWKITDSADPVEDGPQPPLRLVPQPQRLQGALEPAARRVEAGLKIVEFPTCEGARVGGATGAPSIPTGIAFLKKLWLEILRGRKIE